MNTTSTTLYKQAKQELINIIRNQYNDCQYHSIITLNQQYFSEEKITKIFQYMLTNIYHTVYGKHQSLHTKEQMKYQLSRAERTALCIGIQAGQIECTAPVPGGAERLIMMDRSIGYRHYAKSRRH